METIIRRYLYTLCPSEQKNMVDIIKTIYLCHESDGLLSIIPNELFYEIIEHLCFTHTIKVINIPRIFSTKSKRDVMVSVDAPEECFKKRLRVNFAENKVTPEEYEEFKKMNEIDFEDMYEETIYFSHGSVPLGPTGCPHCESSDNYDGTGPCSPCKTRYENLCRYSPNNCECAKYGSCCTCGYFIDHDIDQFEICSLQNVAKPGCHLLCNGLYYPCEFCGLMYDPIYKRRIIPKPEHISEKN